MNSFLDQLMTGQGAMSSMLFVCGILCDGCVRASDLWKSML